MADERDLFSDFGSDTDDEGDDYSTEPEASPLDDITDIFELDEEDEKKGRPSISRPSLPKVGLPKIDDVKAVLEKTPISTLLDDSRDKEYWKPGIRRSEFRRAMLGLGAFTLVVVVFLGCVVSLVLGGRAASEADVARLQIEISQTIDALNAQNTQLAVELTEEATNAAATAFALASPTPTASATLNRPPTFTPTPTQSDELPRALPPPPPLSGNVYAWGGRNPESQQYLFLRRYPLNDPKAVTEINRRGGEYLTVDAGQTRAVYVRYVRGDDDPTTLFSSDPLDPDGSGESLIPRFASLGITEAYEPELSRDGRFLVFVAESNQISSRMLYYYNIERDIAVRLTNTLDVIYSNPTISPDGRFIVAVSKLPNNAVDLVRFDLGTLPLDGSLNTFEFIVPLQPFTSDGNQFTENNPSFSPDGTQVLYNKAAIDRPEDNDIFATTITVDGGIVGEFPVITTPADEILPVYSPDGQYILFSANPPPLEKYDLFIFSLSDRATYQLTVDDGNVFAGSWTN